MARQTIASAAVCKPTQAILGFYAAITDHSVIYFGFGFFLQLDIPEANQMVPTADIATFMMGLSPEFGAGSSIYRAFVKSPFAERFILPMIWSYHGYNMIEQEVQDAVMEYALERYQPISVWLIMPASLAAKTDAAVTFARSTTRKTSRTKAEVLRCIRRERNRIDVRGNNQRKVALHKLHDIEQALHRAKPDIITLLWLWSQLTSDRYVSFADITHEGVRRLYYLLQYAAHALEQLQRRLTQTELDCLAARLYFASVNVPWSPAAYPSAVTQLHPPKMNADIPNAIATLADGNTTGVCKDFTAAIHGLLE